MGKSVLAAVPPFRIHSAACRAAAPERPQTGTTGGPSVLVKNTSRVLP